MRLTAKGMQFYALVGDAFHRIREGVRIVGSGVDDKTLKVKVPPTFGIRWFVPRLAKFHGLHPDIDVQITTSHQATDFEREDVDVAVQWGLGNWDRLSVDFLLDEQLVPVCSPELARSKPLREPRDLERHVLLRSMNRTDDWRIWLHAAGVEDTDWVRPLSLENSALTYQAAIDRLGVVVAQRAFVEDDIAARRLVTPFPLRVPGERYYFLVHPPERSNQPKVAVFRDWILGAAARSLEAAAAISTETV